MQVFFKQLVGTRGLRMWGEDQTEIFPLIISRSTGWSGSACFGVLPGCPAPCWGLGGGLGGAFWGAEAEAEAAREGPLLPPSASFGAARAGGGLVDDGDRRLLSLSLYFSFSFFPFVFGMRRKLSLAALTGSALGPGKRGKLSRPGG